MEELNIDKLNACAKIIMYIAQMFPHVNTDYPVAYF